MLQLDKIILLSVPRMARYMVLEIMHTENWEMVIPINIDIPEKIVHVFAVWNDSYALSEQGTLLLGENILFLKRTGRLRLPPSW